jgi:hypothetical protein
MSTYTDLAPRARQIVAELAVMGLDSPDGTLGVVVRQALIDDPAATAQDVADIWRQAAEDYAAECLLPEAR